MFQEYNRDNDIVLGRRADFVMVGSIELPQRPDDVLGEASRATPVFSSPRRTMELVGDGGVCFLSSSIPSDTNGTFLSETEDFSLVLLFVKYCMRTETVVRSCCSWRKKKLVVVVSRDTLCK
jgi:hypothetical protein